VATEIDEDEKGSSDESILKIARERFEISEKAFREIREAALDDLKFRAGEQWQEDIKRQRELDGRPCFTVNRLSQFVKQVTNDQRQNRPSIKINPVDDGANEETAKIFQGLIRHIEYDSDAESAYDSAFAGSAGNSFGYFRLLVDYCNEVSFDQEIKIERILDPFSVYLDPSYQKADGSDANFGFIFEDLSKEEYKSLYPNSDLSKMEDWESLGTRAPGWVTTDGARIVEYFYREFETKTIFLLSDGHVADESSVKNLLAENSELKVIKKRASQVPTIKWCKLNGVEVLEKKIWPGKWIPIIPVFGDELMVDGERKLESVIRHAKDSQRLHNIWVSSEAETIALAPKAPFIGYAGQFEGFEEQWRTANTRNHPFLQVNPKMVGGQIAPLPQRNAYEPPIQAITQARVQSADDLKATTGIYDAALGAKSNENSGIAIERRNVQSQTANFNFIDNLTRAMRFLGRQLIDLIPKVYDTPRVVRIIHPDDEQEIVLINQVFQRNGQDAFFDLGIGKYDVTVSTGPSFQTKRQEAAASMMDLTRSAPQLMQVAGDLLVKNLDWPGKDEIAERIKKTLPPNITDDGKNKPQVPPEVQQQIAQMQQMIQALSQQLNEASETIKTKRMELESKERIAYAQIQRDIDLELSKQHSDEAQALLAAEIESVKQRLQLLGANLPFGNEPGGGQGGPEPVQENQQPTGEMPGQSME